MDGPAFDLTVLGHDRALLVDRLAEHVQNPPKRGRADRNSDRTPRVDHIHSASHTVGRGH